MITKSVNPPKILCLAGGTGGHIFPALAVANVLKEEGWQACWLGSQNGMEEKIVRGQKIPLTLLNISGIRGKSLWATLWSPFKIVQSIWVSVGLIKRERPTVVLGMGGFASGPGGIAAWITRTPLILHEQNAIPGLTNRILSRIATVVLEAFPGAFEARVSARCVGNPVRTNIVRQDSSHQPRRPVSVLNVLVVGGSLGAKVFNELLPKTWPLLDTDRFALWHQTGRGKKEETVASYRAQGVAVGDSIRVEEFIDDMQSAYTWADIVICRSGALTVSELAIVGLPSILVPFPFAVDDHQTANAEFLLRHKGAILYPQDRLNEVKLAKQLAELQASPDWLATMGDNARQSAKPHATNDICQICKSFIDKE